MLPECTVAAFHYIGADPEKHMDDMASRSVQECRLYDLKPDARMFGFNHPNPSPTRNITATKSGSPPPDELPVPSPGVKKTMPGGLYAAHTIDFPNFHEWKWLAEWAENNDSFVLGGLEEHLNWVHAAQLDRAEDKLPIRVDLLMPIKKRTT